MVLVLALVAGYGVYRVVNTAGARSVSVQTISGRVVSHHRGRPVHASSTPSATPSASATASPNVVISLAAIEDCWVEFTKPDGVFLLQAYVVGGTSKTWTFRHLVHMNIGNPGGIVLTVNGKRVGRPGAIGQPVTLSLGPGQPVTG